MYPPRASTFGSGNPSILPLFEIITDISGLAASSKHSAVSAAYGGSRKKKSSSGFCRTSSHTRGPGTNSNTEEQAEQKAEILITLGMHGFLELRGAKSLQESSSKSADESLPTSLASSSSP